MRCLIVEDALRDRKGHWLEYVSTFVRELRALGDGVDFCDLGDGGRFRKKHGITGPMVLFLGRKLREKRRSFIPSVD